jgi:hypothetical protein
MEFYVSVNSLHCSGTGGSGKPVVFHARGWLPVSISGSWAMERDMVGRGYLAGAVACTMMLASPALALDRKVTIINNSGLTVSYFYGSNVGTTFWEEDLLASDVLSDGASVLVDFDDTTGYCRFDFRAIFDDGTEIVKKDVNVCEISTFTINP